MNKLRKRLLSILLVFATVLSVTPIGVLAEGISSVSDPLEQYKTVYVLAGSDFQPVEENTDLGIEAVDGIVGQIRAAGYTEINGFLFLGDYSRGYVDNVERSRAGLEAVRSYANKNFGSDIPQIYVQGNHDPDSMVGTDLTPSGANDTEDYGVFVINEKDYMWFNNDEATVRSTAENLRAYLNDKIEQGYDKPVFVVSHLPLHYSMRTYTEGDAQYANYLFDVMNAAGKRGLNILYLYGHDHSGGWDDYMGGASVYLRAGDKINIAQGSRTEFKEETLRFTYLNPGYVGYYSDDNGTGVDNTLTMTVFEITDNQVVINRYGADGLHALKSVGKIGSDVEDVETDCYEPNTLTYESPQILNPFKTVTDETGTVTASAATIFDVTLAAKNARTVEGFDRYVVYDIRSGSYVGDGTAVVTIRLDREYSPAIPVTVIDTATGDRIVVPVRDGAVTFNTNRMGEYAVAQIDLDDPISDTRITDFMILETVSELTSGESYVIANSRSGYSVTNQIWNQKLVLDPSESWHKHTWYVEIEQDQTYLRTSKEGPYLSLSHFQAALVPDRIGFASEYFPNTREWTVNQNGQHLNQIGEVTSTIAGGYVVGYDDPNSRWYFYQPRVLATQSVTLTVPFGAASLNLEEDWSPAFTVTVDGVATTQYRVAWTVSNPRVLAVDGGRLKTVAEGASMATATLVEANGKVLADGPSVTLCVGVKHKEVISAIYDRNVATVPYGVSPATPLGCNVAITYDDGSTEQVALTVSMLEGMYNLRKTGIYRSLIVRWRGRVIVDPFTLIVKAEDYPSYPNPGGVQIDKTVTGEDFSASGLLRVELAASGMSVKLNGETGTEILPAATGAAYKNILGEGFTLLRGDHQYTVETDGTVITKHVRPSITVLAHDLYTADDVDGVTVTEDMVGTRKGTYRILETVTFNETGTEAYSDVAEGNLMRDGVLCARTFIYYPHEDGTQWDDDGDGETEIFLEANSLYWRVGTLSDTEVTLTYYAYLENSVEGTRETGEYAVSESLTLRYTNWAGNSCRASTGRPTVSWTQSTDKNGIYGDYYYVDGVRQKGLRLIEHEGHFYLIGENDKLVKNDRVRLTAELLEGFTLSDGTPLPVGAYRFDTEGRLIYPPEIDSDPETQPETESATVPSDTHESDPETDPETEPETDPENQNRHSPLTVGVMGFVGIFVTALAMVTVACLRKREEKTAG